MANVVNDELNLHGAPHTVCEIGRESLSLIEEMSDEELYAQPVNSDDNAEDDDEEDEDEDEVEEEEIDNDDKEDEGTQVVE